MVDDSTGGIYGSGRSAWIDRLFSLATSSWIFLSISFLSGVAAPLFSPLPVSAFSGWGASVLGGAAGAGDFVSGWVASVFGGSAGAGTFFSGWLDSVLAAPGVPFSSWTVGATLNNPEGFLAESPSSAPFVPDGFGASASPSFLGCGR